MTIRRICMPVEQWPEHDRRLWRVATAPTTLFEDSNAASAWGALSRHKFEQGYGRWLHWLEDRGCLDPHSLPAERVNLDQAREYAKDLATTCRPRTVASRLTDLSSALRVFSPTSDWRWLSRASRKLQLEAERHSDKRARLKAPAELIAVGVCLMKLAEDSDHWSQQRRAVHYRDGLIIAFLASRPVRMRNLASMMLGVHLREKEGGFLICFPAKETKAHQPYEAVFPEALLPFMRRYLEHYRPVLQLGERGTASNSTAALWVSEVGTHLDIGVLGVRIRKHTAQAFGRSVNPHLFRDAAATEIAISNPRYIDDARHLLGHANPATTERYYNQANSLSASKRYIQMLEHLGKASEVIAEGSWPR